MTDLKKIIEELKAAFGNEDDQWIKFYSEGLTVAIEKLEAWQKELEEEAKKTYKDWGGESYKAALKRVIGGDGE